MARIDRGARRFGPTGERRRGRRLPARRSRLVDRRPSNRNLSANCSALSSPIPGSPSVSWWSARASAKPGTRRPLRDEGRLRKRASPRGLRITRAPSARANPLSSPSIFDRAAAWRAGNVVGDRQQPVVSPAGRHCPRFPPINWEARAGCSKCRPGMQGGLNNGGLGGGLVAIIELRSRAVGLHRAP